MARLSEKIVWAEMARRKVQFHKDKAWDQISLWGLFHWGSVSHLLEKGKLLTTYQKHHKIIWVRPSKEMWEKKIQPLIENHSLEELTKMAGWEM